jgi:DNA-binding NarL/FixJ family response regulator
MQKKAKLLNNAPIRIAVVEDHTIVRQGLAEMLAKNEHIEVIIEAENGQEFLDLLANKPIDIVLLDFEMPLLNGRSTLEILQRDYPSVRSIMLSMYKDPWIVATLIGEGANGFLKKNCSYNELISALIDVFETGSHFNDLVTSSLHKTIVKKSNKEQKVSTHFLSEREENILTQICIGKTSDEIAKLMLLSKKTIDLNRSDLMKRFGASNSASLVNKCMLLGLYTPRTDEEVKKFEIKLKEDSKANRKKCD